MNSIKLIITTALIVLLTACGGGDDNSDTDTTISIQNQQLSIKLKGNESICLLKNLMI